MSFLLPSLSNYSPQNCVQPKLSIAISPSSVIHQLDSTQLAFLFIRQSCPHLPGLIISSFLFPKWVSESIFLIPSPVFCGGTCRSSP